MIRVFAALMLLLLVPPARAAADTPRSCAAAPRYLTPAKPLASLRDAIAANRPVRILAIGSAATVDGRNGTPGESFPYHMLAALRAALPQVTFELTVRGGAGMTAQSMLPLLRASLRAVPPVVVLWQTGTVEAVRALRPNTMRAALRAGLEAVREAGANLVLIDPQFTRALRANADIESYQAEILQVAALPGANLFRRYELTRAWALDGHIDPERAAKDARTALLGKLHACLGETLAQFLLRGAGAAPP